VNSPILPITRAPVGVHRGSEDATAAMVAKLRGTKRLSGPAADFP